MSQTLLRRNAEAMYWAGRHLERAEGMARIVLVHGNTHVDLPVGEDVGWSPLLRVSALEDRFAEAYPEATGGWRDGTGHAPEGQVIDFLLASSRNPDSILASITTVREALRSARSSVPREAWELTNAMWSNLREERGSLSGRDGRVHWLRQVIAGCERINGTLWGSMRRDCALAVTRIGQHLERADLTCRFLSVRSESALSDSAVDLYEHVRAMSLLRSLGAFQQYQRAMPARPNKSVAEFMVQDESFPRTVTTSLAQVREHLKELPRNEEALAACTDASVAAAGTVIAGMSPEELGRFLDTLGEHISVLHERITSALFAREPDEPPRRQTRGAGTERRGGAPAIFRRYRIVHETTYRYDELAEESHNETHLRPRDTLRQRVRENSIQIEPVPTQRSDSVDALGNHVTTFFVRGSFGQLSVTSTSEVDLLQAPPPPTGPPWESVRSTLERDRRLDTRSARMLRAPSRLVPNSTAIAAYAAESFEPRRPMVEAVRELSSRINADFTYEPGFTSVTTPLLEVFESRRGVCQDFAHLAICCLRAMGLAARYVSGYVETFRPVGDQLTGADSSHAWASTYLPGWGWVDLDPTNNLIECAEHVTTAWGRDYHDVSPLRGSVVGGGHAHTMEVAVGVRRLSLPG